MLNRALLVFLPVLLALGGCSRPADISKPKHYRAADISFDYPGNWKITKDDTVSVARFVLIEGSGHAIVALTVYHPGVNADLQTYADAFTQKIGEAIPFKLAKNASTSTNGAQIDCKYSITLVTVKMPHTANMSKHVIGQHQVICLTQVSDENRYLVEPGFDLVRRTLAAPVAKSESTAP